MMPSEIFKRKLFIGQKYLRMEDLKPGTWVCVNRMLLKGEDLNQKCVFSKYVLNFIAGAQ